VTSHEWYACECCERPVCYRKKPGLGYLCDPCVKCFTADPPLTGDEPLPQGVSCYFVDDLAWMQAQANRTMYDEDQLYEARIETRDAKRVIAAIVSNAHEGELWLHRSALVAVDDGTLEVDNAVSGEVRIRVVPRRVPGTVITVGNE
jgi:hypothetical protein